MAKIFISYSSSQIEETKNIAHFLENSGHLVFWDKWFLNDEVSNAWKPTITKYIEEANIFLFLLSPEAIDSYFCIEEYNVAVNRAKYFIGYKVSSISADYLKIGRLELIDPYDNYKSNPQGRLINAIENPTYQLKPHDHIDKPFGLEARIFNFLAKYLNLCKWAIQEQNEKAVYQFSIQTVTLAEAYDDNELIEPCQNIWLAFSGQNNTDPILSCNQALEKIALLRQGK